MPAESRYSCLDHRRRAAKPRLDVLSLIHSWLRLRYGLGREGYSVLMPLHRSAYMNHLGRMLLFAPLVY